MSLTQNLWLKKAEKTADRILDRAKIYESYPKEDILSKVDLLKNDIKEGKKSLDDVLIDAFALVQVVAPRTVGLTPYKVQIIGGIALHEGVIAELKTGEGKTLVAAAPAFLHALSGEAVHIVTVNPYLTQRDAKNIGRIFEYLGLSVGCVVPELSNVLRKEEYSKDVTYVSNTELGFDYLRDNLATNKDNQVQRGFDFAIVDEADSILIDEAKTPLIISGEGKDVSLLYQMVDNVVSKLKEGTESRPFNKSEAYLGIERVETGDYIVHEKEKTVMLTKQGIKKVEEGLALSNYSDEKNRHYQHTVEQSLRAYTLMEKDKDYIVKNGKIYIVDEFTGRVMEGRQYSDGLHQAIEAKEGVPISTASETTGTTTYQNFFRKYKTLSGMTGTAESEKKEFKSTYNLKVRVIPTNKPVIRKDYEDKLYIRKEEKYKAVLDRVLEANRKGQPVLIGTSSVEESENFSMILRLAGLKHEVLNAKQDAREAKIIAKAGEFGSITVATNMAGRGTDIMLDENAKKAGGLLVIGTEKHESIRIDNQLRGRSGRQGDAGESVFYCSTEDRVMRLYGSDRYKRILTNSQYDTGEEVKMRTLFRAIRKTQKKVEADNFAQRRDTLEYDDVNNTQRERIYAERQRILDKEDVSIQMEESIKKAVKFIVENAEKDEILDTFISQTEIKVSEDEYNKAKDKYDFLVGIALKNFKEASFTDDESKLSYYRKCLLIAIDSAWSEQLKALEFCRDSVSYAGYGQMEPKAVYAHDAYKLYEKMLNNIYLAAMFVFFHERPDKKSKMAIDDKELKLKSGRGMNV